MQRKLYRDLYNLEGKHWWHKNKRSIVLGQILRLPNLLKKKIKILDIGCGTGKNLEKLKTNYEYNSSYWMLLEHSVNSLHSYSEKLSN